MKYIGLTVYLEPHGAFWCGGYGSYLLGKYQSDSEMVKIARYQMQRFYMDETKQKGEWKWK